MMQLGKYRQHAANFAITNLMRLLRTPKILLCACLGGFSDLVYLTMGQLYSGACLIIKQLTCGDGLQVVVVK